jgi:hypothetical protein
MRKVIFGISAIALLAACSGKPSFDDEALSDRQFNLEEFFDGEVRAYGQFQDILGTVRRSFAVEISGEWDGNVLRLTEDFIYEDGATEQRIWTLSKIGEDSWVGTAPGVIGHASGKENGDRFNWRYTIDLPVPSSDDATETMRVSFDDWMWLIAENRVFNRAYISRAGVSLGDVSIMFEKD